MQKHSPFSAIEFVVPEGEILVSQTDLKGVITYCNQAFADISGYAEGELLGQPHSIVRHPDVPKRIFAQIWDAIEQDDSWHGMLKNRHKNGGYYWVYANITPLFSDGKKVGYVSLRHKPTDEQIARADEYFYEVRQGKLLPLFSHKPNQNYVVQLQQRLAEKIVAQEDFLKRKEEEHRIAAGYMNKLIALDKITDPAVKFYVRAAENFSGDLIGVARTPDGRLHVLLADSTGHGLSAALAAMPMIHPFYSMTHKGFNISAIAAEMNGKIWQSLPVSHFVAAILVSIDTVGQMVEVWSGGCPPPMMLDKDGACAHQFKPRHLAMGILPPEEFDATVEYFSYDHSGYSVLIYSDGVIELEDVNGEQFGLQRLQAATRGANVELRWSTLIDALTGYGAVGKGKDNDDISLILAQCEVMDRTPERQKKKLVLAQGQERIVWQFSLMLDIVQIRKLDVVPLLLDIVQQVGRDKNQTGQIFMILSELFNNALDHGILKLDSELKQHEDGMESYYEERAKRLAVISEGSIQMSLKKIMVGDGSGFLRIKIKDSGDGFDHRLFNAAGTQEQHFHGRGIKLLLGICRTVQFIGNGSEVLVRFDLGEDAQAPAV